MTIRRSPFYFREMSVVALYNLSFQHTGVPVFGGGVTYINKKKPHFFPCPKFSSSFNQILWWLFYTGLSNNDRRKNADIAKKNVFRALWWSCWNGAGGWERGSLKFSPESFEHILNMNMWVKQSWISMIASLLPIVSSSFGFDWFEFFRSGA